MRVTGKKNEYLAFLYNTRLSFFVSRHGNCVLYTNNYISHSIHCVYNLFLRRKYKYSLHLLLIKTKILVTWLAVRSCMLTNLWVFWKKMIRNACLFSFQSVSTDRFIHINMNLYINPDFSVTSVFTWPFHIGPQSAHMFLNKCLSYVIFLEIVI